MKICMVGAGYVGLVTGACFADVGNNVIIVDKNLGKIEKLRNGKIPIYEPGLETVVNRNVYENRLLFTPNLGVGVESAEICFICVDTPPDKEGNADLTNVFAVAKELGETMNHGLYVVDKSTVPVGTARKVKNIIMEGLKRREKPIEWIEVVSNPEFLKEGDAVNDFQKPSRIVVGADSKEVLDKLHVLYAPFMMKQDCFLGMNIASAELTKYASNAMLASRISFMNEIARVAEHVGADIKKIKEAVGRDPRIGPDFLYAGIGYGGSCFPKDVKALIQMGSEYKIPLHLVRAVDQVNEAHREWFWEKISKFYNGKLEGIKIAIWGGAFKANTDDIRHAPALFLVDKLLEFGARVALFDPAAGGAIKNVYGNKISVLNHAYEILDGAEALVVATEWSEFRSPDFDKIKQFMKVPVVFDGRNIYDGALLAEKGFKYFGVGVNSEGI